MAKDHQRKQPQPQPQPSPAIEELEADGDASGADNTAATADAAENAEAIVGAPSYWYRVSLTGCPSRVVKATSKTAFDVYCREMGIISSQHQPVIERVPAPQEVSSPQE